MFGCHIRKASLSAPGGWLKPGLMTSQQPQRQVKKLHIFRVSFWWHGSEHQVFLRKSPTGLSDTMTSWLLILEMLTEWKGMFQAHSGVHVLRLHPALVWIILEPMVAGITYNRYKWASNFPGYWCHILNVRHDVVPVCTMPRQTRNLQQPLRV